MRLHCHWFAPEGATCHCMPAGAISGQPHQAHTIAMLASPTLLAAGSGESHKTSACRAERPVLHSQQSRMSAVSLVSSWCGQPVKEVPNKPCMARSLKFMYATTFHMVVCEPSLSHPYLALGTYSCLSLLSLP